MDILQQPGQQPQNKPAAQSGSGFTNLSSYINANQNNQLGQTVGGGVQQAGQAATGAVNQAGQQFNAGAQTEQQRLSGLGQTVNNTLGNNLGNLGGVNQSVMNSFQQAESGKGQGPTGLSNTAGLMGQAQNAQQLGQATGSQAGRYNLLQQYVGRGQNYGLGQQGLDEAILGQTGQKQLQQAKASTANLPGQTQQQINAYGAQGQQLSNQAKQLAQNTQNQLGSSVNLYNNQMVQNQQNQVGQYQNALNPLGGTQTNAAVNIDPKLMQQLSTATGGVLSAGTNLYNVDPTQYVSVNQMYNNPQAAQSQADFSKIQALGQLAGNSLAGQASGNLLQQYISNPSAVGQLAANPYNVSNNAALANAISGAKAQYQADIADPTKYLNTNAAQIGALNGDEYNALSTQAKAAEQAEMAANPGVTLSNLNSVSNSWNDMSNSNLRSRVLEDMYSSQLNDAAQKWNVNRILGVTPPAQNANPVIGNGGQPLTS